MHWLYLPSRLRRRGPPPPRSATRPLATRSRRPLLEHPRRSPKGGWLGPSWYKPTMRSRPHTGGATLPAEDALWSHARKDSRGCVEVTEICDPSRGWSQQIMGTSHTSGTFCRPRVRGPDPDPVGVSGARTRGQGLGFPTPAAPRTTLIPFTVYLRETAIDHVTRVLT
jgi:hypothetical protein